MPDQARVNAARDYIKQYESQYSVDVLKQQLLASGYAQEDIDAATVVSVENTQKPVVQPVVSAPVTSNVQRMSTLSLAIKTTPYFLLRAVVYTLIAVCFVVFAVIWFSLMNMMVQTNSTLSVIFGAIFLMIMVGAWRFMRSYLLYMVKAGHIAVVSELVRGNALPDGQGQISYGTAMVKKFFLTANAMYIVDNLVSKAVQEIKGGIDKITDFLDFIPGMRILHTFLDVFVSIFLGYSDEAVFGHIFLVGDTNAWKSAADGVVLYAQNWKELMKSAAMMSAGLIGAAVLAGAGAFGLGTAANAMGFDGTIVAIIVVAVVLLVKWVLVDPLVMIFVLNKYLTITEGQKPAMDLYGKLQGISKRFSELVTKSVENKVTETIG